MANKENLCTICNRVFHSKVAYTVHLKMAHNTNVVEQPNKDQNEAMQNCAVEQPNKDQNEAMENCVVEQPNKDQNEAMENCSSDPKVTRNPDKNSDETTGEECLKTEDISVDETIEDEPKPFLSEKNFQTQIETIDILSKFGERNNDSKPGHQMAPKQVNIEIEENLNICNGSERKESDLKPGLLKMTSSGSESGDMLKPGYNKRGEKLSLECQQCKKWFATSKNRCDHIRRVHNKKKKEWILCTICTKKLSTNVTLRIHINTVHEKLKPFKCHLCKKAFGYKSHLEDHTMQHNKTDASVCQYCRKRFSHQRSLTMHIKASHLKLDQYKCHICFKSFCTRVYARKHVISVHEKIKGFICESCGKEFTLNDYLQTHIRTAHKL